MDNIHRIGLIEREVSNYYSLRAGSLQKKTRKREIVQARQIAMYFSKSLTKSSLELIGTQIGGKNHATVLHACKTVNNLIDTDKQFRSDICNIELRLNVAMNRINLRSIFLLGFGVIVLDSPTQLQHRFNLDVCCSVAIIYKYSLADISKYLNIDKSFIANKINYANKYLTNDISIMCNLIEKYYNFKS